MARLLDDSVIAAASTYREAVRGCWHHRNRPRMTKRQLAEETGCYASRITDYLSEDEGKIDLPARHIAAVELACGNHFISQWIAMRSGLLVVGQESHGD